MKGWIQVLALSELSGEFEDVSLRADAVLTVGDNFVGKYRVCSLLRLKGYSGQHGELVCIETASYIRTQLKYADIEDWNKRPKEFWDAVKASPTTSTEYLTQ